MSDSDGVQGRGRGVKPALLGARLHGFLPASILRPLRQVIRGACYGIGWILYQSPKREQYLHGALCNQKRTLLEHIMAVYFFSHRFYLDVSRYRSEVIGKSPVGDAWLEVYRSRRATAADDFREQLELLGEAIRMVQAKKVLQVGCGSGGELWVLAQRFPGVEFVGLDLNDTIIRRNATELQGMSNLRWLAGDVFATDYLERECADLVFTSGAAEYFAERELETFLERTKRAGTKGVCFYESVTQIGFDYHTSDCSTTRGMMAFNHPYGKKLRAAGAQVVQDRLVGNENNPYVVNALSLGCF